MDIACLPTSLWICLQLGREEGSAMPPRPGGAVVEACEPRPTILLPWEDRFEKAGSLSCLPHLTAACCEISPALLRL